MTNQVRNIYAAGNTARGYHHFYESVLQGLERVYILTGGPGLGKSTTIRSIGNEMLQQGHDIEWIHSPLSNEDVDGFILTEKKIALIDGTYPRSIKPRADLVIETYIDLSVACDTEKLLPYKDEIVALNDTIAVARQKAYATFATALKIHDEWEKFYISNMDYAKANQVTAELIDLFLGEKRHEKQAHTRHMFFGAATPQGAVDHILQLTKDLEKRYFIKGRPGSGKSTMLKKLAAAAEERGFDVEIYHCGFDPNSLDMVVLPECSIAIFDSTAPHEYFPEKETDEVVDMYVRTITPGTDERYADQITEIKGRYSAKMKEATSYLGEAKAAHDKLVSIYANATDFNRVNEIKEGIMKELDALIN